jgi:hypothetical protein
MKHPAPTSKKESPLELGIWNFSGAWSLEFGAFVRG